MRPPARVELVCVGTELLDGKVNTHASWLARELAGVGLRLSRETTVGDGAEEIGEACRAALDRADAVLVAGGLGPTFDDLTREGVAAALGRTMRFEPSVYARIRARFARYRFRIPRENRRQAFVIEGAQVLDNPHGSAPGQWLTEGKRSVFIMPGPGREMMPMFRRAVLPALKKRYAPKTELRRTAIRLCGISESAADEALKPLYARATPESGLSFTILAEPALVDLHIAAAAETGKEAGRRLKRAAAEAMRIVGKHAYGRDADTLESVVGALLKRKGLTLAVAESCTAGLLAHRLTAVPGSSDYFLGGTVCYSNESKVRDLGVSPATLGAKGAVSRATAKELAEGVRARWCSEAAVAITGIAGPGGGTKAKPVGTTFIAIAREGRPTLVKAFLLPGDRAQVRTRAATAALVMAWRALRRSRR